MANAVTERDMLDLLLKRYTAIRPASIADRWVRAEHVQVSLLTNGSRSAWRCR